MGNGVKGEFLDGRWALVDAQGNALTDYKYWFIEPCGEGYFRAQVTGGSKYNILSPEGKEIFNEAYNYISEIHNGIAICSNTKRKTKRTQTIYQHGILHVSGQVIVVPSFTSMHWLYSESKDNDGNMIKSIWGIYAAFENHNVIFNDTPVFLDDGTVTLYIFIDNQEYFEWNSLLFPSCTGCIYSHIIPKDGSRCGRLEKEIFRFNAIKGNCQYYKSSLLELSEFEKREKYNRKETKIQNEKKFDEYQYRLVSEFINECLDGDISKITRFNFDSLQEKKKYQKFVSSRDCPENVHRMDIIRSLMYVLWGHAWPNCTYKQIENGTYQYDEILSFFQMFFSGIDIGHGCEYFKAQDFFAFSEDIKRSVYEIYPRFLSLANMVLMPAGITRNAVELSISRGKRLWREYPDSFLATWREAILSPKSQPYSIQDCIKAGKKAYADIHTEADFNNLLKNLMLDDFLAEDGSIPQIFDHIFVGQKGLMPREYFPCVERYLDLCNKFFDEREKRIIEKLQSLFPQ